MNDQERSELLIKAAVKFEGKWPKGYNSLIFSAEFGEGIYGDCAVEKEKFISVMGDSGVWLWVCTQAEFEAFMDDLADKAPDRAECCAPSNGMTDNTCYYRNIEDDCYEYCYSLGGIWNSNSGKPIQGPLIPLPKRAEKQEPSRHDSEADLKYLYQNEGTIYFTDDQGRMLSVPSSSVMEKTAPWVPEVGQECEFSCTAKGKECEWRIGLIEYLSSSTCVINPYDAHGEFVAHPDTMKFRPIRTEAEIERESLVAMACAVAYDGMYDEYAKVTMEKRCKSIAESFVDAGWRPNE